MRIVRKLIAFAKFMPWYIYEVVKSNFRVAYDIVTPKDLFSPAIVAIPLEPMTDMQLMMVSNLMTMTPGTLTLDVSPDRKILYVHAMYASDVDGLIREFKEKFEPMVRNAF